MKGRLRKSGIDIVGDVPWGTHFCQFYQTKEDLIEILVPYFKAGLENNEFCLWVTSEPLGVEEAKEALKKAVPELDICLECRQIEIIPESCFYVNEGIFNSEKALKSGTEMVCRSTEGGYCGLRTSGNVAWLKKTDWRNFTDYEEKVDSAIDNRKVIALCTYPLERCSATEIIDVVTNHQFTLVKREGKWEQIESPKLRKAEETAIQVTKNWEYTFDAVPDFIAILDTEYQIVRANRAMAARLNMTPEECEGLTCYRVIHGTDKPPAFCPYRQLLTDELEHTAEVREDSMNGDFVLSVTPLHDSEGRLIGCIHFARDITKRKEAEDASRESGERLRFALETSHTGAWDLDLVDNTAYRSLEYDRIFGYQQLLPQWTYEMFLDHVLPEDREMVDEKFHKATATHSNWNFECRIRRLDGAIRWIWAAGRHIEDVTGSMCRMAGIVQDITERKRAEEALRRSEEKYRNLMETANEGIWVLEWVPDAGARTTYVNDKMAEMLGCSQEELIGKSVRDFTDEEGKAIFEMNMKRRQQGVNESHEFKLLHKDGSPLWAHVNSKSLFDENGRFTGSMSLLTDITDRKEAEAKLKDTLDNLENLVKERTAELEEAYKSLKESEKGLAEAQRMAHIGKWEWDIAADEAYWSDEIYRIFERSPQELAPSYNEYLSYVHPDDRDYVVDAIKKAINGKTFSIDHRIILDNGEERTIHKQSEVIFNEQNIPVRLKGIVQDITERKEAKRALELSEERYRIVTEQTGQLVYDYDAEKDTAGLAGNIEEVTGFTPDELGSTDLDFWISHVHPEDLNEFLENHKKQLGSDEGPYRMEYRFRKKNGEYIYLEDNWTFLRDEQTAINRILGVIKDITERKKAEMALLNIETARKKEIHHRIKNNLQVISSLLDLQAEKFRDVKRVGDSEVLKAFRESQDRVISIALIHEELHEGKGNDRLNFSPYLHRLVENLFQTYTLGNMDISLNMDLEENVFFDMDTAVPLGLIVNELVSNSLKYAFRGRDKGLIRVRMSREENRRSLNSRYGSRKEEYENVNFILTVSDNGIGLPEGFSVENSDTLGIQLVTTLVDQLDGEIELNEGYGIEFIIRFSIEDKK
jgi:PAS domain S-box-containing protein